MYRRKALEPLGGMVAISHSEDMHTGFKIADFGYKVRKAWWSTRMTTRQIAHTSCVSGEGDVEAERLACGASAAQMGEALIRRPFEQEAAPLSSLSAARV